MNVLSRERTDHFIHLFVERRADLARALTTGAKITATQEFRAAYAELIKEMQGTRRLRSSHDVKTTIYDVGITGDEVKLHTDGALEILRAINGVAYVSADFPAALRKRAAP